MRITEIVEEEKEEEIDADMAGLFLSWLDARANEDPSDGSAAALRDMLRAAGALGGHCFP